MPSDRTLRVAALQLNSRDDRDQNLEACRKLVAGFAADRVDLCVLPENFAYLGPEHGRAAVAEPLGDWDAPIQRALVRMARDAEVAIVAGGFPEASADPQRPYTTAVVISPQGRLLGSYRKIHHFDVQLPEGTRLRESAGSLAGSEPVVVGLAGFGLGLSICYDLRFPELYRALVARGADVLLVPAAFTSQTGRDHWRVLLRARAIESQCWVIAANQWGRHFGARSSYGHSMIVDPWGTVVAECSDQVGGVLAQIEGSYLQEVRAKLPSLQHRRLE